MRYKPRRDRSCLAGLLFIGVWAYCTLYVLAGGHSKILPFIWNGIGNLLLGVALLVGLYFIVRVAKVISLRYQDRSTRNELERTRRQEMEERERIRAGIWLEATTEAERRRAGRREEERERSLERGKANAELASAVYQQLQTLEQERASLVSRMANLYHIAKKLQEDGGAVAEVNSLHNQIADIKARKIQLSKEIDELKLKMKQEHQ